MLEMYAEVYAAHQRAEQEARHVLEQRRRRAERAIREHICEPAGLGLEEAALAIRRKVDANMADAIFKEVAVKGYDPRQFTLFSLSLSTHMFISE